ncbi:hypothetical protein [Butyrivibrio sp. YAB3001]|uniref:hypothetical protein n=1 Tax=Butyrivibrio sp. YAB3001 TaxID=1520812 RepID=UPI0008F64B98|nr:hypothetical protein [Butyrivibrio sp. YAB3001]SFD11441.1 hypothetical protein SAMN02910398_04098 [Butyrivibrio sp. YAB3001]
MEELVLLEPSSAYYDQIKEYRQEFLEVGDSMDGTSSLREYEKPSDWVEHIKLYSSKETIPEAGYRPHYFCVSEKVTTDFLE